jgi:hypothetical protein
MRFGISKIGGATWHDHWMTCGVVGWGGNTSVYYT